MDGYTEKQTRICEPLEKCMKRVLLTFEFNLDEAKNALKTVWETEGNHMFLYHLFNCYKLYLVHEDLVSMCVKYGMKKGENDLVKKIVSLI